MAQFDTKAVEAAPEDGRWMAAALQLARRGLGRVAPNPAVGCVLVKDGSVVGRGWTQPGGRPHAETEGLSRAGASAEGATAYVTLEPCSHSGQTGPCAEALVAARISRAVVAHEDPDKRVSGRGIRTLRTAGVDVVVGVMAEEAYRLNLGYILNRTEARPLVTLKLATSLDGRIATADGTSKWITGEAARADAHLLRMGHDAVLVGIGTVLADDPALDRRLPGIPPHEGRRVVLDTKGRLSASARFCDGTIESVQITGPGCPTPPIDGVERIEVPLAANGTGLSIPSVLNALAARGITRLMVEGGGAVAASFVNSGFVDRIHWYHAGLVLGADGVPCIGALSIRDLMAAQRYGFAGSREVGSDRIDCLEKVT